MLQSFVREAARWQCWFYGWGTQTSSSLEDVPCLEDHQKNSCLSQAVCTSAAKQLEPKLWLGCNNHAVTVMGNEKEAGSVTNPNHTPQRSPICSQLQIQGLGLNFLYNPAFSRTLGAQKAQWALVGDKSPFLSYYLSPHMVNNCHLLNAVHCANSFKAHYTLQIPQPVLHYMNVGNSGSKQPIWQ